MIRVGLTNKIEHIDFWDYDDDEKELAQAQYDNIKLYEGLYKYIAYINDETDCDEWQLIEEMEM